jgi:hypothetical protein
MKRAISAVTFALAMVALNGARPAEISAQASIGEDEVQGCFAVYCITCQAHHIVCEEAQAQ